MLPNIIDRVIEMQINFRFKEAKYLSMSPPNGFEFALIFMKKGFIMYANAKTLVDCSCIQAFFKSSNYDITLSGG